MGIGSFSSKSITRIREKKSPKFFTVIIWVYFKYAPQKDREKYVFYY